MSRSTVAALTLVLFLSSCRDEAAEAFARADLKYRALVTEAARPDDPRFDAVLADLAKVTPGSKHYAAAQKLVAGLNAGRTSKVRTPLALAGNGRRPPQLEAQLAACARLAEIAGADGGVDRRALEALEACRLQAEKMELAIAHGDEHVEVDGGEE